MSKWYLYGIAVISLAVLTACGPSRKEIRGDSERQAMQVFADAYRHEQQALLLRKQHNCAVVYPEVMMLKVRGGVVGPVYIPTHEIPVFVEQSEILGNCTGRP